MNRDDMIRVAENFDSYLEVLCKAILLDKVSITEDKRIKVDPWE